MKSIPNLYRQSILFLLFLLSFNKSSAQLSIGFKGGVSYSNMKYSYIDAFSYSNGLGDFDQSRKSSANIGFQLGTYVSYPLFLGKGKLRLELLFNKTAFNLSYSETAQFDSFRIPFSNGGVEIPYDIVLRTIEMDYSNNYITLSLNYHHYLNSSLILNFGLTLDSDINTSGNGTISYLAQQEGPIVVFEPNTIPPHPSFVTSSKSDVNHSFGETNFGFKTGFLIRFKSGFKIELNYFQRIFNFQCCSLPAVEAYFSVFDYTYIDKSVSQNLNQLQGFSCLFEF